MQIGHIAGCLSKKSGYILIRLEGRLYRAHRLAWLYMTGEWPSEMIDHKDGDRANNRFINLRDARGGQNHHNGRMRKTNSSGYKGVSWSKGAEKWSAQIKVNWVKIHLGLFEDPYEAHKAYVSAAAKYHGEFANDGYGPL